MSIRSVRGAKSFNVCMDCAAVVDGHPGHLSRGESIAQAHPDGGTCPVRDPRAHLAAR